MLLSISVRQHLNSKGLTGLLFYTGQKHVLNCEVETRKEQSNQGTGLPDKKGEAFDIVRSLILCFL